jgi:sensor histidine kinase YesM
MAFPLCQWRWYNIISQTLLNYNIKLNFAVMTILKIYQNFFLRNLIINVIIFGLIFVSVYDEVKFDGHDIYYILEKITLGYFPCIIWITLFNLFIIKPFLFRKKLKTFFFLFIVYWTCFYFIMNWYFPIAGLGKFRTLSILSLVLNGTAFYLLHNIIMKKVSQTDKDLIKFRSELSFLKQQLNPHFLLNAMNNLYGESLAEPDKLPDRILNLSEMLRYQIEATQKDFVLLEEEIAFIKKYIEYYTFQNDRLLVTRNFEGDFDHIEIPPLFFLPLVENAVKFSSETTEPFIIIDLKVKCGKLSFTLKNNFLESGSRLLSTGIGIENLNRRLEVYGLRHELNCKKEKNIFIVKLNIWHLPTAVLS